MAKAFWNHRFCRWFSFSKKQQGGFLRPAVLFCFVSGHLIPEAIKDHRELGAGGCSSGVQRPCAGAAHDAVGHGPLQGFHCVPRHAAGIRIGAQIGPLAVGIIPQFRKAVQQGHQLLPGHRRTGVGAVGDAVVHGPGARLCHVGGRLSAEPRQDHPHLG